ncbi:MULTISPECIES: LytTR family DNA-binding domain-containing protein [unclassified Enterococcus]|uniref:LytR/AlgR family response regulator transcription factor n=1 Tax=unclassified Enterococcus TaxID=2608891 RepID=UPI0013EE3BB5|nr:MULTISPECIES: LytTR family DNA-binding domain-containing protein [unclassified Enterococcus]
MLKIFVCDDEKVYRYKMTKIIQNYILMQDYDFKFQMETANPNDILSYIRENKTEGLYFLDIELNSEMSGIELAVRIREYDPLAKIVFVTTYTDLAYLTFLYKVEALDYIVKEDDALLQQRMVNCIEVTIKRYMDTMLPTREQIQVKSGPVQVKLFVDEILFFESSSLPHKIIVHLDNRIIEYTGKIKDIEKFSESFCRCHQSFVVNIDNIAQIDRKERIVTMNNGAICLASTRHLKNLLVRFEDR